MTGEWPALDAALVDGSAEAEMRWLVQAIGAIRTARSELNVPASAKLELEAHGASDETRARLERNREAISRLARLGAIRPDAGGGIPGNTLQVVVGEATFVMPVADVVDLAVERARLQKEHGKAEGDIRKMEQKLANGDFIARAPEAVVEEQRERLEAARQARSRLEAAIDRIVT